MIFVNFNGKLISVENLKCFNYLERRDNDEQTKRYYDLRR